VSAAEAYESERRSTFAKEIGNRATVYREGELVAVNGFGNVYRFDERTTGKLREDINLRLAGIDPAGLMNVADTTEAMRAADRAAWAEARERARPATAIEQRIIDCAQQARRDGFDVKRDDETVHLSGAPALAMALDKAGIAIVRVTAADEKAIDALRDDEDMERLATAGVRARRSHRFDDVKAGEIAAVDRFGNVHQLNRYRLDLEDIERTLIEAQIARVSSADRAGEPANSRLPSVTEARATFEIARETTADMWAQRHANRIDASYARDADREIQQTAAKVENAARGVIGATEQAVETGRRGATGILGGIAGMIEGWSQYWADFFAPPPPPTNEQVLQQERAAEEKREHEARVVAPAAEQEARFEAIREQMRREAARQRLRRERGMERDDDDHDRDRY
jgi:hypothetical protein